MNFKHTKFEDSSTMRSLVKVAQEKGWVKEEPLQKTAAPKVNLKPSNNFIDNLLKLCNGLRSSGFDKQADELESKLVQYKQAGALYDVGNEKGEDLVHAAHPKGSHKMENVDSKEATFEDILDKHLKMLDVANGQPTGKHSSAQDILKTVKRVLAQGASKEQLESAIQNAITTINSNVERISTMASSELTFSTGPFIKDIAEFLQNPTIDNLRKAQDLLGKLETRLNPSGWFHHATLGTSGLSEDTWQGIQGLLDSAKKSMSDAISWRSQLKQLESGNEVSGNGSSQLSANKTLQIAETIVAPDPIVGRLVALTNKLKAYSNISSIDANAAAKKWVAEEINEITNLISRFNNVPEDQVASVKEFFEKDVATKESEVSQFASTWLARG